MHLKPVLELAPNTPPGLAALIHKCLEYDANRRPEMMLDVQKVLTALAEEEEAKLSPDELEG